MRVNVNMRKTAKNPMNAKCITPFAPFTDPPENIRKPFSFLMFSGYS